jgi:hypothetical protein
MARSKPVDWNFDPAEYEGLSLDDALCIELESLADLAWEFEINEPGCTGLYDGPVIRDALIRRSVQEKAFAIIALIALKAPKKLTPNGVLAALAPPWVHAIWCHGALASIEELARQGASAVLCGNLQHALLEAMARELHQRRVA